jgi:hypothetical protein
MPHKKKTHQAFCTCGSPAHIPFFMLEQHQKLHELLKEENVKRKIKTIFSANCSVQSLPGYIRKI